MRSTIFFFNPHLRMFINLRESEEKLLWKMHFDIFIRPENHLCDADTSVSPESFSFILPIPYSSVTLVIYVAYSRILYIWSHMLCTLFIFLYLAFSFLRFTYVVRVYQLCPLFFLFLFLSPTWGYVYWLEKECGKHQSVASHRGQNTRSNPQSLGAQGDTQLCHPVRSITDSLLLSNTLRRAETVACSPVHLMVCIWGVSSYGHLSVDTVWPFCWEQLGHT